MTAAAEKTTEEVEVEAARKPLLIHPAAVKKNRGGSVSQVWVVFFPEGARVDDLADPSIWRSVQGDTTTALRRYDELRVIAYDNTWEARCVVAHASLTEVVLTEPVVTALPPSRERLLEDDRYAIRFVGGGYCVVRKSDGLRVSDVTVTLAVAEKDFQNQYPTIAT